MGTEQAPSADEDIDKKKSDGSYELTDAERKEKKRLRQVNGNAYINLQLSCEELPYDLVSLAKTEELPDGCARDAWERLTSEFDLTKGEDKITLLSMFQQNQLEDVRTNITFWLTSMAIQVNKLKKLNHVLDEENQITHILASLPRDVKWTGKMWTEFYKSKLIDTGSGHVDPDEDFKLEEEEDQDVEEDESEVIQVGQSQSEEPTETPVGVARDEPVASRTRSQTTASESIAARTRQALESSQDLK